MLRRIARDTAASWKSRGIPLNPSEAPMRLINILAVVVAALSLAGCEVIGDIFKAGMWVGVLAVVAVIVLIGFVISRFRK
jgi:hypothetical protein